MDHVLRGLRFRDSDEDEDESRAVRREDADLVAAVIDDVPPKRARPEPGQPRRIDRIEGEADQASRHRYRAKAARLMTANLAPGRRRRIEIRSNDVAPGGSREQPKPPRTRARYCAVSEVPLASG